VKSSQQPEISFARARVWVTQPLLVILFKSKAKVQKYHYSLAPPGIGTSPHEVIQTKTISYNGKLHEEERKRTRRKEVRDGGGEGGGTK